MAEKAQVNISDAYIAIDLAAYLGGYLLYYFLFIERNIWKHNDVTTQQYKKDDL